MQMKGLVGGQCDCFDDLWRVEIELETETESEASHSHCDD